MRRRLSTWLAASAAMILAVAALLGIPQAAHADTVVGQSAHVTWEMSSTSAAPGDTVTFTFTINNTTSEDVAPDLYFTTRAPIFTPVGPAACTTITGPAPDVCGVNYSASDSPAVTYAYNTGDLIPANSTAKVTITTTVAANASPGSYPIRPNGSLYFGGDPEAVTPSSFSFVVSGPDADLAVGLTAAPAPLLSAAIDYTQTAANNGPAGLSSATITTTLPSQTASVTGLPANCTYDNTAKQVACTLTGLANGATATNTFTAQLNLLSLGALPATATRTTSSPADPSSGNDTDTANCTAVTSLIITC